MLEVRVVLTAREAHGNLYAACQQALAASELAMISEIPRHAKKSWQLFAWIAAHRRPSKWIRGVVEPN